MFFCFWDNCIWRCCNRLSLLRTEYLSLAVNVLTNSPKILHITKRAFFQLSCLHNDQWIWERRCLLDFNSVSAHLSCYLLQGPLKRDFLDVYLTTFFGVSKSKKKKKINYVGHLFLKNVQNWSLISKMQKKIEKKSFVLQIIASEDVAINCLY